MIKYREIQYFHPLLYVMFGGTSTAIIATVLIRFNVGEPLAGSALWIGCSLGMLLLLLACGRMEVTVDEHELAVSFGWLGIVRRAFTLTEIDQAKVCIFSPLATFFGWGWRYSLDGSVCYTAHGQRGVELIACGRRHIVGSRDPMSLKVAILGAPEESAEVRAAPKTQRNWARPKRQRSCVHSNWGLIDPRELREGKTVT